LFCIFHTIDGTILSEPVTQTILVTLNNTTKTLCCYNVIIQLVLNQPVIRVALFGELEDIKMSLVRYKSLLQTLSTTLQVDVLRMRVINASIQVVIELFRLAENFLTCVGLNRRRKCVCNMLFVSALTELAELKNNELCNSFKEQQDASEILLFLGQTLSEIDLTGNSYLFPDLHTKFTDLFEFTTQQSCTEASCGCISCCGPVLQSSGILVDLPFKQLSDNKNILDLQKCIVDSSSDSNELLCTTHKHISYNKYTTTLKTTPKYLIVTIKRNQTYNNNNVNTLINSTTISFPQNLFLSNDLVSSELDVSRRNFELVAVINRVGKTQSGHYDISIYSKASPQQTIYHFSDATCSQSIATTSCDIINSNIATILIYERCNNIINTIPSQLPIIPSPDCSLLATTTLIGPDLCSANLLEPNISLVSSNTEILSEQTYSISTSCAWKFLTGSYIFSCNSGRHVDFQWGVSLYVLELFHLHQDMQSHTVLMKLLQNAKLSGMWAILVGFGRHKLEHDCCTDDYYTVDDLLKHHLFQPIFSQLIGDILIPLITKYDQTKPLLFTDHTDSLIWYGKCNEGPLHLGCLYGQSVHFQHDTSSQNKEVRLYYDNTELPVPVAELLSISSEAKALVLNALDNDKDNCFQITVDEISFPSKIIRGIYLFCHTIQS
jgi:hypothetical protein